MLAGQSGTAQEDNYGRHGMVSVLFDGYPKPKRIEASRLIVTAHDPNAPKVIPPTYPNPVSKPPLVRMQPVTKSPQETLTITYKAKISPPSIKTSKEKALATRQALVRDFPAQEDRDAEEAYIHARAHRFTEMRKARFATAYWK